MHAGKDALSTSLMIFVAHIAFCADTLNCCNLSFEKWYLPKLIYIPFNLLLKGEYALFINVIINNYSFFHFNIFYQKNSL